MVSRTTVYFKYNLCSDQLVPKIDSTAVYDAFSDLWDDIFCHAWGGERSSKWQSHRLVLFFSLV